MAGKALLIDESKIELLQRLPTWGPIGPRPVGHAGKYPVYIGGVRLLKSA